MKERKKDRGWKKRISVREQSTLKEQRKKGDTRGMFNVWYPLNKIPRASRNIVNRSSEKLKLNRNQRPDESGDKHCQRF